MIILSSIAQYEIFEFTYFDVIYESVATNKCFCEYPSYFHLILFIESLFHHSFGVECKRYLMRYA